MSEKYYTIDIMQSSMVLGLWLGSYQVVKFAMVPLSIKFPILGLPALILFIGVPFVAWKLIRNFRDTNTGGFFPFITAWLLSLMMFLFATMISSIAVYIYLRYIDNGFIIPAIVGQLHESRQIAESTGMMGDSADYFDQIEEFASSVSQLSPLQLTKQITGSTLSGGNILSIIIAVITAKYKLNRKD